jgi:hypothetical protein
MRFYKILNIYYRFTELGKSIKHSKLILGETKVHFQLIKSADLLLLLQTVIHLV